MLLLVRCVEAESGLSMLVLAPRDRPSLEAEDRASLVAESGLRMLVLAPRDRPSLQGKDWPSLETESRLSLSSPRLLTSDSPRLPPESPARKAKSASVRGVRTSRLAELGLISSELAELGVAPRSAQVCDAAGSPLLWPTAELKKASCCRSCRFSARSRSASAKSIHNCGSRSARRSPHRRVHANHSKRLCIYGGDRT